MTADARRDAQRLAWHAAALEDRGYPWAPEIRRLARSFLDLATTEPAPPEPGRCRCGRPLRPVGPKGGRPRKWCTDCSPPETRRKPRMLA